jgi:hypothetical protein
MTRRCRGVVVTDGEQLVRVECATSDVAIDAGRVDDALPLDTKLETELRVSDVVLDETSLGNVSLLAYVRMIVNQIDRTKRSHNELVDLLCQAMKQHSIAKRIRTAYVLGFLHQRPP